MNVNFFSTGSKNPVLRIVCFGLNLNQENYFFRNRFTMFHENETFRVRTLGKVENFVIGAYLFVSKSDTALKWNVAICPSIRVPTLSRRMGRFFLVH